MYHSVSIVFYTHISYVRSEHYCETAFTDLLRALCAINIFQILLLLLLKKDLWNKWSREQLIVYRAPGFLAVE
jgi:hypothetical protein